MITLLLANWRYVVMALLLAAVAFYRWDAQRWEKKYYTFEAQVKVLGEAAKERAKAQEMADKLRKDTSDAEHKAAVSTLAATIKRLRDTNTYRGQLPAAPASSSRPDLLCLDRTEYQREDGAAFERLREGARSLADEGSKNTIDLNTGKKWVSDRITGQQPR